MTAALVAGCIWVVVGAAIAMMPMRLQRRFGGILLLSAPILIWLIWRDYGMWPGLIALGACLSMFRKPLIYLGKRALGLPAERPDLRE